MACEDQITQQNLIDAKSDAITLGEVATSKAGAVSAGVPITTSTNRFGLTTDTVQGRLNKLGIIFSDPIDDWTALTLISELRAHRYPATTGDVYIPIKPLPFTTGAIFNTDDWVLYSGVPDDLSRTKATIAAAKADDNLVNFVGGFVTIIENDHGIAINAEYLVVAGAGVDDLGSVLNSDTASLFHLVYQGEEVSSALYNCKPDNLTDCGINLQNAFATGKNVRISGQLYTTLPLETASTGQKVISDDAFDSWIRGEASVDPVMLIDDWFCELHSLYVLGGVTAIQVGTVAKKANFASLLRCHAGGSSATSLKVVHGNIGQITAGMYENSPVNIHFTDETQDTNGWNFDGPRAYAGVTNVWIQGDGGGRFADDNHGHITSENYTGHGFKVSSVRNNIILYAESTHEATTAFGLLDESSLGSNNITMIGTTSVDPAGTHHGLLQSVSPIYDIANERVSPLISTLDMTLGSKTHQQLGWLSEVTAINTGATPRNLNLQKLESHLTNNPFYIKLGASNVGDITVVLDDPVGFAFNDGSTSRRYPAKFNGAVLKLTKVDSTTYTIEEIISERQPAQTELKSVTASTSIFMSGYRDGSVIEVTNTSGSTKNLTVNEGAGFNLGAEMTFYHSGTSAINLILSDTTYADGSTSKVINVNTTFKIKKVGATVFTAVIGS